jgi:hypothetical protein
MWCGPSQKPLRLYVEQGEGVEIFNTHPHKEGVAQKKAAALEERAAAIPQ